MSAIKELTHFDIFNAMPDDKLKIFSKTGGGKVRGRGKKPNATIEMWVDYDTFQSFAGQKLFDSTRNGESKKMYMLLVVDEDEYYNTANKIKK